MKNFEGNDEMVVQDLGADRKTVQGFIKGLCIVRVTVEANNFGSRVVDRGDGAVKG